MKKSIAVFLAAVLAGVSSMPVWAEDSSISIIGGADGPTSVFLAGKYQENVTEADVRETMEYIYQYKSKQIDADTMDISNILFQFFAIGILPQGCNTVISYSQETPQTIEIQFQEEDASLKTLNTEELSTLGEAGTIFLALFDDLEEVVFTYGTKMDHTSAVMTKLHWSRENADQSVELGDVSTYGSSLEKFLELTPSL